MRFIFISLASALAVACSSGGGGGGAVSCADGGACPSGLVCDPSGVCVQPGGTGGSGATGATGAVGGFGGGSGGTTTSGACASGCQKAGEVTCTNPVSPTCVSDCEQARNSTPACASQFDAFISCQVANGTAVCDADGDPTLESGTACDGAQQAFSTCVASGSGGGGGTGGFGTGGAGTGGFGTGGFGTGGFGTGGTGTGGAGGGPACGIAVDGNPVCDACGDQFCCSQLQKCGPGTTCNQLLGCISANCPTDGSCINTTCSQFASALPDIQAVTTCVCNSCSSQCATFCAP